MTVQTSPTRSARVPTVLRLVGRVIGVAAGLMWSSILIGSLFEEPIDGVTLEGLILGSLVILAVAGVVLSFIREKAGAWLTMVAGYLLAGFALATAGRNHMLAVLTSGAPFAVAGALMLQASLTRKEST